MNSYSELKKEVGFTSKEIEEITGYTRQGINYAFRQIEKGCKPSRGFLLSIEKVLNKRIEMKTSQYENDMERLKTL